MDKQEYKFRASWTVLNNWASGNWERAIKDYFKLDKFTTPAMDEGKRYHKKWAAHIEKTGKLPDIFGGKEVKHSLTEVKSVVDIAPWLRLVYIMDCYCDFVVYDWKTGKQSSETYASSMQLPLYAVGATFDGIPVKKAEIHHYDQHIKKADMSIVWITDKKLDDAHNWLVTMAGEMQTYLLQNKLYERFGKNRKWD